MRPPRGYRSVDCGRGAEAFATREARPWVQAALAGGRTLHEAALAESADDADAPRLQGRGPVPVVETEEGRWVVRHYYRGGAMATLLHDRYFRRGTPRPVSEARSALEAELRGVATPRVVAAAVYPAGLFYRADLVTEYVPRSRELADVLFGEPRGEGDIDYIDPETALVEAGRLLVHAAESGIFHPDLNARNILLAGAGEDVEPWLIDLDRCRFDVAGPDLVTATMVRRLERSLRKIGASSGRGVDAGWFDTLHTAVREGAPPGTASDTGDSGDEGEVET